MTVLLRRRKLGLTSCREVALASTSGIRVIRNDRTQQMSTIRPDELVIRWGCTANVNSRNVLNKASAIHEVNDKTGFRAVLEEAELCPTTWFHLADVPDSAFEQGVIVRPQRHSRGRQITKAHSRDEALRAARRYGEGSYFSKFVSKVAEYRIFVVSGRVVAVANKIPDDANALAWNVAQGGSFENVRFDDWPLKAVRVGVEGFNLTSLDFGGVDVMVDAEGNATILEINSAPSLTSPYRQSCFAKAFDYIVANGKDRIAMTDERGGYRKFIHPAVSDRAIMV